MEALQSFYKGRQTELRSKPELGGKAVYHIYEDDGNLVIKGKDGAVKANLTVPKYRPVSYEERDIMEVERRERIAEATRAYDEAFQALHDEYTRKDRSVEQVLQKTRRMVEADHHLQHTRFPLRYVTRDSGIEIRKLDFNQPTEVRKLPYDIARLCVSPFTLQELYVREGEKKEEVQGPVGFLASLLPAATGRSLPLSKVSAVAAEKGVLFIEDAGTNENGFMALDWPVQIRLQSMTYHCAKQALAAEQARAFGDDEGFRRVMEARTPAEVSYTREDAKKTQEEWELMTRKKLYEIQEAKFRQYPELQSRLLSTGEAILAVYLPRDAFLGIGLSTDDVRAKNPIHWKGQNMLGTVLMEVRQVLRREREEKGPAAPAAPASSGRFSRMRRPTRIVSNAPAAPAAPAAPLAP